MAVKYSIPCDKEGRRRENAAQQEAHGVCTNEQLTPDCKQPCARNFVPATPVRPKTGPVSQQVKQQNSLLFSNHSAVNQEQNIIYLLSIKHNKQ